MPRARFLVSGLVLAALAAGCAETTYIYRPEENATATMNGNAAAHYAIAPDASQAGGVSSGDVRVASFGVTTLEWPAQGDDEGPKVAAMHVRMVAANTGQIPWTIDTREQIAYLGAAGTSRSAYVRADGETPPTLRVPAGQKRTIDFFYPLPQDMQSADHIPEFDLAWTVHLGDRVVRERTPFARLRVEPASAHPDASFYYGYGWGPYGWYDPYWYPYGFHHSVVIAPAYGARPPMVAPPAWHAPMHAPPVIAHPRVR